MNILKAVKKLSLEEKVNYIMEKFINHNNSMQKHYDDFSDQELQDILESDEHKELTNNLSDFYKENDL